MTQDLYHLTVTSYRYFKGFDVTLIYVDWFNMTIKLWLTKLNTTVLGHT